MLRRLVFACTSAALAVALAGCAAPAPMPEPAPAPAPAPATPPAQEQPPTSELRLAPGLYNQEDGTVQGLGTLVHSDLEGGFWTLTDGTLAEGDEGKTIAVISNSREFAAQLEPLEGQMVMVKGERQHGTTIRMAGAEVKISSVEPITDTPGIAE